MPGILAIDETGADSLAGAATETITLSARKGKIRVLKSIFLASTAYSIKTVVRKSDVDSRSSIKAGTFLTNVGAPTVFPYKALWIRDGEQITFATTNLDGSNATVYYLVYEYLDFSPEQFQKWLDTEGISMVA